MTNAAPPSPQQHNLADVPCLDSHVRFKTLRLPAFMRGKSGAEFNFCLRRTGVKTHCDLLDKPTTNVLTLVKTLRQPIQ